MNSNYTSRKTLLLLFISLILNYPNFLSAQTNTPVNLELLKGIWQLDMTPQNPLDSSFASMHIRHITSDTIKGYFYRKGVEIKEGRINQKTGILHVAFVTSDNSGDYNTAFHYKNGKLHGSTHSLKKDFLSVWTATKLKEKSYEPVFRRSKEPTHKIPDGQEFTFGYLEVPENRNSPSSNTIKLPVYIFKSRSKKPKLDPIIYTVGGPGNTSMRAAQYMNYYQYLDQRDFILFEQRGTKYAQPNLACPEWSEAIHHINLSNIEHPQSDSLLEIAAMKCRKRLTEKGIDLDGYNTNEIAADINDLVEVLDIKKYNLLTISYSTKIAQILMRDYPKKIRSVVMDSPLPVEVNWDEESTKNLMDKLSLLLSDCASDKSCSEAFPKLKERFYKYLIDKTNHPLVVSVKNPNTEKEETFRLKGKDLINIFTNASTNDVNSIPLEIDKLLNNDLSTIKMELSYLFRPPNNGDGQGMRLSVWCAEEFPFTSSSKIKSATYQHPQIKGLSPTVFKAGVCKIWGVKKANAIENKPVKSDIPVLLLSGEYDETTPPEWAENMISNLSNSFHLIFKGWKHGITTNWAKPCGMETANIFFNNPSQKPASSCFEEIKPVKFITE